MPKSRHISSLIGLPDEELITLADVAGILKIHPTTAWELVTGGAMPFLRFSRQIIRVEVGALRAYIDSRRVAPR